MKTNRFHVLAAKSDNNKLLKRTVKVEKDSMKGASMETFPAHILRKDGCCKIQEVMEHCINTARYAKSCLDRIGLGNAAFLAGLLHDMGKCTLASKRYQEAVSRGENVRRGSVIHTFQCCRYLLEKHNDKYESYEDISRELLAFAASAHHGLYDCYNEDRESGFLHRKRADNIESPAFGITAFCFLQTTVIADSHRRSVGG